MVELETGFKLAVYGLSWLYLPAVPLLVWWMWGAPRWRVALGSTVLAALSILAWARFIEPTLLQTVQHDLDLRPDASSSQSVRITVFSDTHIGLFGNAMPIERIVDAVNDTKPDLVMIPGDFVYFLEPEDFEATFAPLARIEAPVFAVLGNHDLGIPGPDVRIRLKKTLTHLGVHVLDDRTEPLTVGSTTLRLSGLSDLWEHNQDHSVLTTSTEHPRIVLTHNPNSILEAPAESIDLLVAGHTHGGQINLPGITCWYRPTACLVARTGFKKTRRGDVFITSGTGMVGLPMRFNMPPRIDVLNVQLPAG